MKNIILCGFMGCGKSTIGRKLSQRLEKEFVDMDRYIEAKEGLTVKEIFEKYGEEKFRELETQACRELSEKSDLIIAAGGGTLTFQRNIDILSSTGRIVYVDVKYEMLCERLKRDTRRPLLQVENRNEVIKELLEKRRPIYERAASIYIDGNFTSGKVANIILGILQ
ncbi:MAG: shikimate kinase [Ruminococcus sp.]|nr:shikimate kinase [Ruminococcus sp.]